MPTLSLLRFAATALGMALVAITACTPGVDCEQVKPYAEITAFENSCVACHSSALGIAERSNAPLEYNYDTYDGATNDLEELIEVILEGEMPPADGPPITPDEEQDLLTWAQCGAPE